MRQRRADRVGGSAKFFSVALSHNSLANIYQVNFALVQHHKYSLTEIENLIPFELEIYLTLLTDHLEREFDRNQEGEQ